MSDFIEYASILLITRPGAIIISAVGDDMYPVAFSCELLT